MAKFKGILFDYGHTLVWFPRYKEIHLASARNMQRKLRALGVSVEASEIQALVDEFAHNQGLRIDEEFREILSTLGVKRYSENDLHEIIRLHWRPYLEDACARKGAKKLLEYLKSQGYRLGVVANVWSGGMSPALQKLGLQKFFDTTVASVDVGFRKPSPEIFQLALDSLGLNAERAMMVGDNPLSDIQGAHDIGMCAVRLMRGPNRTKPDIVKPDFKIKNLLTLATIVRTFSDSRVEKVRI